MSNADEKRSREERKRPPKEGPPWDLPLAEAPFAFVDLEMTGLDHEKDEIIEICIERVRGDDLTARFESLICPERASGKGMFVHGVPSSALASAPKFGEVADRIQELLQDAIFVAHGAQWDVRFLERAFARAESDFRITHWIDTLHLTRRAFALESHSLDSLRAHFGIDTGPAHRAGSDVAALRAVFHHATVALAPKTPRDLWEVRVGFRAARSEIVEACERAIAEGKAVKVTYRPSRRAAENMRVVLTGIAKSEDGATVKGYDADHRGRVELRAERILSIAAIDAERSAGDKNRA